jgi:3-hydroxybutyryl-CoA dehydrogenase
MGLLLLVKYLNFHLVMNILVVGGNDSAKECRYKFGPDHTYIHEESQKPARASLDQCEVVFDFLNDLKPNQLESYRGIQAPVFINTAKISLHVLNHQLSSPLAIRQFGFAGLPTFLNRPILEVSLLQPEHRKELTDLCHRLRTDFQIVEDRAGLVTPRVICMIINEAYFTVEEGTATREDIDLAMTLGTNYPFGPFEWCRKIGVNEVYELLAAVYEDSKNPRYKICPLLRKEYLAVTGMG